MIDRVTKSAVMALAILLLAGCGVVKKDNLVLHPDSPMLVTGVKDDALRVSVYDAFNHELVDYGWIATDGLKGWTIARYDWAAFIDSHR